MQNSVSTPNLQGIYDVNYIVNYNNTQEYRNCIRGLFKMKENLTDLDLDEETLDEQNYDNDQTSKNLDYIYNITKNNIWFQNLYDYGAGVMFSQDREIGLAVLFSYDYFLFFHHCICSYIQNPLEFNDNNDFYNQLKTRFIR